MRPASLLCLLILLVGAPAAVRADVPCPGSVYGKGQRAICLPLGERSFADAVASFVPGARPSQAPFDDARRALGAPDFRRTSSPDFISLGCDGVLTLRFLDNALVDVDGPDLHVFEVGPQVEPTALAISTDGAVWHALGRIEGARAAVDIAAVAQPGERYTWVRLTNAGPGCGGRHSGADIDAVAAVGSALRLSLDSAVLFDVGSALLKPEAQDALDTLVAKLRAQGSIARLTLEGHTDASGSAQDNRPLSQARAEAVWRFLATRIDVDPARVERIGYGESRPVADNTSEAGRAANRRVDVLVVPGT